AEARQRAFDFVGARSLLLRLGSWAVVMLVVWHGIASTRLSLLAARAGLGPWGGDFHGGAWLAAKQIIRGSSPYLSPDPALLLRMTRAFVTPPAIGLAALPLAHLPYGLAVALWNLADLVSLAGALWLIGVRDLRMYFLALFSAPLLSSVSNGQVEGVFALLLALTWRYRDSWLGAVAAGALIATKLYAFPLVIWLIATKRLRGAATTTASTLVFLFGSWAVIDFHGLLQYPRLLNAATHAAEQASGSLSVVTLALRLGMSPLVATMLGPLFGLILIALIITAARSSDQGWFAASITGGLIASPILWEHYLVLLFVPLAVSRPRTIWPWLLTALFSLQYGLNTEYAISSATLRAAITLVPAAAIPLVACAREQRGTKASAPGGAPEAPTPPCVPSRSNPASASG
ncbi:MAG TPA: glycosyltransferase family 87 protein, partial [Dehalococcoidia bacterium]|nr:glycosyltransferase family 87 protein [Dehalococcoidia bacterium]